MSIQESSEKIGAWARTQAKLLARQLGILLANLPNGGAWVREPPSLLS
jgi:hypothetical protein